MDQTHQSQTIPTSIEDLLEFPCQFNLKIMGINVPELISEVTAIIAANTEGFEPERDISIKPSSKGNYVALTAMIQATSKAQLDIIYTALNNHSLVKITL